MSPILTAWPKITQQETLTQDYGGGGGGDQDGDQVLLQSVPLDADQLLLQGGQQGSRPVYKGLHFLLKQCLLQTNLFMLLCLNYVLAWYTFSHSQDGLHGIVFIKEPIMREMEICREEHSLTVSSH